MMRDTSATSPGEWALPSPDHADLLEAALCSPERARAGFLRWRARHPVIAQLDAASRRLLPLVAHRLSHDPLLADLEPLPPLHVPQRRARFEALHRIGRAARWVDALRAAGITPLCLKGLALSLRYYPEPWLRPMEDVDLLVAPSEVPSALRVLHALGFSPTESIPPDCWPPSPSGPNLGTASVTHACGFVDADGHQLDLHWAALSTHCADTADDRFRQHAGRLQLAGDTSARCLAPAHELVHTLIHGLRWNSVSTVRWIADAAMIIQRSTRRPSATNHTTPPPELDWSLVEEEARARGFPHAVGAALRVLQGFDIPVPSEVVSRLTRQGPSSCERLRMRHHAWPWDSPKPLDVAAYDVWRFCEGLPLPEMIVRLGRYATFRLAPEGRARDVPSRLLGHLQGLAPGLARTRLPGASRPLGS